MFTLSVTSFACGATLIYTEILFIYCSSAGFNSENVSARWEILSVY